MSHLVADIIEVKMADTINIILEFLHRHHFSKAAAVLREEVTARQQLNGLLPVPLNDDRDLDVAIYLKSVQEKGGEHHHLVDAALEKHEPDTQNKPGREVKPSAQQLKQEQEVKEKLHGQDESQSTAELEEPESDQNHCSWNLRLENWSIQESLCTVSGAHHCQSKTPQSPRRHCLRQESLR